MKEIADKKKKKKKKNRGGKMEKKKRRETHRYGGGNLSFSRWLFDYTRSETFKDKMKRKFFLNPSFFFFFLVLNEDASDVIWPFAVWNTVFLAKRKKKMKRKFEIFLSKENKNANYESLKHFVWMLCRQHILGTWSLFILC